MIKKYVLLFLSISILSCSLSINPHKKGDISFFKKNTHEFYSKNVDFTISYDFLFNLMDNFDVFDADMRGVNILPVFVKINKKNSAIKFNFEKSILKNQKGKKFKTIKLKEIWKRMRKFYKVKFYNKHMTETFNNSFNNLLIKNSNEGILSGFILFDVPNNYNLNDFYGGELVIYGDNNGKKCKWHINIKKN